MKLIIEPDQGSAPLLSAIKKAKRSIQIAIFRFDRKELEAELKAAASRGVKVTALIAYSNHGGHRLLRDLEMRFLEAGIIVARTSSDLTRYHNKMMIVDHHLLHVLSFNFTHLDIGRSRGFGIATRNSRLVQEAAKLFEADCTRTQYTAAVPSFVVSPANARAELSAFLRRARKQLLIYDPEISDKEMIRTLKARAKAGVEIRIIGHINKSENLQFTELSRLRLHTRTIIRDRSQAFVGSQSLRAMELDQRREVGIIVRDAGVVKSLVDTFESDWAAADAETASAETSAREEDRAESVQQEAVKIAEVLAKELQPVAITVKRVVKKVVAKAGDEAVHDENVKRTVKKIVKKAVKDAVKELSQESHGAQAAV